MDCKKTRELICLSFFLFAIISNNVNATTGLVLSGNQTLTISQNQTIVGDINLSDHAVLTIKNAVVLVQHSPDSPRENIYLYNNAKLVLQNASLVPVLLDPANLYLYAFDNTQIIINNGSIYNVLNLVGNSEITGRKARIYSSTYPFYIPETGGAFGIVQVAQNAVANFSDSTIGSFALFFGPQDNVTLSDLKPQTYANFNLKHDSQLFSPNYNIILKNTTVLPVKLHGPFERSWSIFVDPATHIIIRNSSLNKLVFQQFQNESLTFNNLKLDTPLVFDFRNIHLSEASIANEWGFFGTNCNITVVNSSGVWLLPYTSGTWKMFNSHMIEFDPRGFNGTLIFNNSEWANAGEVLEGTSIQIFGTLIITQNLSQHLVLSDSTITRHYPVQNSIQQVVIKFTPANYHNNFSEAINANGKSQNISVSLFSDTPLLTVLPISTVSSTTQQSNVSTRAAQQNQQSSNSYLTLLIIGIIIAILITIVYILLRNKSK